MNELTKELERVLTIDGIGRPKKAALLLEIIQKWGLNDVLSAVQEITERKHF